jgi:hypothetical protein
LRPGGSRIIRLPAAKANTAKSWVRRSICSLVLMTKDERD